MNYPSADAGRPTEEELDFLAQFAYRFSVPTVIRMRDEMGRVDVAGASGMLIVIGGRKCLITAHHVVAHYRSEYARDAGTLFDCMTEIFNPDRRVLGESETSDLIVIDIEGIDLKARPAHLPPLEFFEPERLPGSDVNVGERVFFGGWPKAYRDVSYRALDIHFGYDAILNVPVTGVSEHEFQIRFDRTEWIRGLRDDDKPADYVEDRRLGGHSGAGVFRLNADGARPELVGFIKEAIGDGEGVICCPVTKIRSDATVKHSSIGFVST